MSKQDKSQRKTPIDADRSRRRFLGGAALAAAGTSAALVPGLRTAAAEASSGSCPSIPLPMKDVEGKVAFITGGAVTPDTSTERTGQSGVTGRVQSRSMKAR